MLSYPVSSSEREFRGQPVDELVGRLPKRLRVVGPCFVVALVGTLLLGLYVIAASGFAPALGVVPLLLGPMCGPFAEPFTTANYSLLRDAEVAMVLGGMIALHPLYPNSVTAFLCVVASGLWWFIGHCHIYVRT